MFLNKYEILKTRQAIESTYDRVCDIVEYQNIINPTNKRTKKEEITVLEKQHCRISYSNIQKSNDSETGNSINQIIKLFITPEIEIKPRLKNHCYKK